MGLPHQDSATAAVIKTCIKNTIGKRALSMLQSRIVDLARGIPMSGKLLTIRCTTPEVKRLNNVSSTSMMNAVAKAFKIKSWMVSARVMKPAE
eukprot:CAMPEP_0115267210 /NCGR_PEP_ID=MMETSP0270-20121206/51873_1 /TAXON_ID=71861 /ORGANISM="Scrippsiella trochoidea, Strain CCMP3099" /LENGTH=92 /DNA_ID=CAMNT_0002683345 /DNA_START=112 /DNA_END=390 /DNA_ORIENTATION=+